MTLVVHERSIERAMQRGREPRTLGEFIEWYVESFRSETTERLHIRETWHDYTAPYEHVEPVGGSLLGTPAYSHDFRRLLEGSPHAIDEDGMYLTPMRAALARISYRRPFMACYLFRLAQTEGDWRRLAVDLGYPDEVMEVYTESALRHVWHRHERQSLKGVIG